MNEVSINKNVKLSPHFTLGEVTKTSYQTSDGNIPSRVAIENLKRLCVEWLEELRERYNSRYGDRREGVRREGVRREGDEENTDIPMVITSGYRSAEVNRLCGGSATSNHLTGCAVDIRCMGPEQLIRYATILLDLSDEKSHQAASELNPNTSCGNFDELLFEKRGSTYWLHFAVRPKENRRKIIFDCR
jgi:uncharacterized protein YcbK (DUF882 family)